MNGYGGRTCVLTTQVLSLKYYYYKLAAPRKDFSGSAFVTRILNPQS